MADAMVRDAWQGLLSLYPWQDDEDGAFAFTMSMALLIGYWLPSLVLLLVWKFNLFVNLKINPLDKSPPPELVRENLLKNLVVHTTVAPAIYYFAFSPFFRGQVLSEPPPLSEWVWQTAVWWVLNDFWFYWAHRISHDGSMGGGGMGTAWLYQLIHKKHHKYVYTIGTAAVYATDLEDITVNWPSTFGPPLLMSMYYPVHASVFVCYLLIRMEETVEGHSGYRMPLSPWHLLRSNDFHAYHHRYFNRGNFGIFTWWDSMCGTDRAYRKDREVAKLGFWD